MFTLFLFVPSLIIIFTLFLLLDSINFLEFILSIAFSAIIIAVGYFIGIKGATNDTEYWSNSIMNITYYEYWETYEHRICQRSYDCNCSTDSKGSRSCQTCYENYDCSYCDHNPAHYVALLNSGSTVDISLSLGEKISRSWRDSKKFENLNRRIDRWGSCGKDGDAYNYFWDKNINSAYTYSSNHIYENRINASENIFAQPKTYDLKHTYEYPKIINETQAHLVGYKNSTVEQYLQYWNGKYGKSKQIKFFTFVWPESLPISMINEQKARFNKCNKNEFILCLFVDKLGKVTHSDYITWSEVTYNDVLFYDGLTVEEAVKKCSYILEKDWKRLEFNQFAYLTVYPSKTGFILTFIINIILSIGLGVYFHLNEFTKNNKY